MVLLKNLTAQNFILLEAKENERTKYMVRGREGGKKTRSEVGHGERNIVIDREGGEKNKVGNKTRRNKHIERCGRKNNRVRMKEAKRERQDSESERRRERERVGEKERERRGERGRESRVPEGTPIEMTVIGMRIIIERIIILTTISIVLLLVRWCKGKLLIMLCYFITT